MALPKCPHCGSNSFTISTIEPLGSQYKANLVTCRQCAAPVGALEYYDAGVLLKQMQQTLSDLEKRLRRVEQYAAAAAAKG
jgi:predicted nucleic-acid-binding Zn-ribbon protein